MDCLDKLEQALGVKVSYSEKKYSMRNNVFYVEAITGENVKQRYVIKEHTGSSAGNEVFIVDTLHKHGINVPEIIWHDDKCMIMQYIPGLLLTDLLAGREAGREVWVNALARWLRKLHGYMNISSEVCLCMSDLNLRNFIFNGREFYGIDFESVCFYPPERDLGGICAFILNNDPMFEQWKFGICRSLIRAYETMPSSRSFARLDRDAIQHYLIEELKAAAERRESQRHYLHAKIQELSRMAHLMD